MNFVHRIGSRLPQVHIGRQLRSNASAVVSTVSRHRRWHAQLPSTWSYGCSINSDLNISGKDQCRYFSSGDDEKISSEEQHKLFKEQLLELEQERTTLFGTNASTDPTSNTIETVRVSPDTISNTDMETEPELTIEEMNKDREAIYNFSKEEKNAWANTNVANHSFDPKFLEMIDKAREAKAEYERSMTEKTEEHLNTLTQESLMEIADKGDTNLSNAHLQNGKMHNMEKKDESNDKGLRVNEYFTHLNEKGDEVSMVDVGEKEITRRIAVARTSVYFPPEVMDAFGIIDSDGKSEMIGKKGPIFSTARLAGIMGAKRTSDLIPLCHPLPLDKVHVDIRLEGNRALIECECRVTHKTGVEMEALAGASIAALTIYDMVKAVSHRVRIETTELVTKTGGKRNISNL